VSSDFLNSGAQTRSDDSPEILGVWGGANVRLMCLSEIKFERNGDAARRELVSA
jgi:hypothetical protein